MKAATKKAASKTKIEGITLNPKLSAVVVSGSVVGACVVFDGAATLELDAAAAALVLLVGTTDELALQ